MKVLPSAYTETAASAIRPPCGAKITIKGYWLDGEIHTVVFNTTDIQKIRFQRRIDPTGSTLPYMRVSWTTFYSGSFTESGAPEDFDGIVNQLSVEIEFEQTTLSGAVNAVKMPLVFLDGPPSIDGRVLKWSASDVLSLMTNKTRKVYRKPAFLDNVVANTILDARSIALKSTAKTEINDPTEPDTGKPSLIATIEASAAAVADADLHETADHVFLFDGETRNLLKDFLAVQTRYIDFAEDGSLLIRKPITDFADTDREITFEKMLKEPKQTLKNEIVAYSYEQNDYAVTMPLKEASGEFSYAAGAREIESDGTMKLANNDANVIVYHFTFPAAGELISRRYWDTTKIYWPSGTPRKPNRMMDDYKRVYYQDAGEAFLPFDIGHSSFDSQEKKLVRYFLPYQKTQTKRMIEFGAHGEVYEEDNDFAVYGPETQKVVRRYNFLRIYTSGKRTIEFQIHGDLAFETGDLIEVQTTRSGDSTEAVIVELDLSYNGKLTEKIRAMEV